MLKYLFILYATLLNALFFVNIKCFDLLSIHISSKHSEALFNDLKYQLFECVYFFVSKMFLTKILTIRNTKRI